MKTLNNYEFIDKLASLTGEINEILQDEFFDNWAIAKRNHLLQRLTKIKFDKPENIFLGHHLHTARPLDSSFHYSNLDEKFLTTPPSEIPNNSVFILLNNDIAPNLQGYLDFYKSNPNALFIIWDWDSQHWFKLSAILAMNCDFYISASSENTSLLSQFSPNIIGPVFACVHQWTKKFIVNNIDTILNERLDVPLGMHVFYEKYTRRNRAIATVNKVYPSVSFANNDFKNKSELENLTEWASHKSHWIMPVMSGVPIRIYNALITGGIPILPKSYQNLPEIQILGSTPLYYDTIDLIEPNFINNAAVERFNNSGVSGLINRVSDSINKHHVDCRCHQIINLVNESVIKFKLKDYSYNSGYVGVNNFT